MKSVEEFNGILKQFTTGFFYWWYNMPGKNTINGYDDYIKTEEGEKLSRLLFDESESPSQLLSDEKIACKENLHTANWDEIIKAGIEKQYPLYTDPELEKYNHEVEQERSMAMIIWGVFKSSILPALFLTKANSP